ncbi:MAG: hypothetical protein R3C51_03080 [Parvularculaceae bacterium]
MWSISTGLTGAATQTQINNVTSVLQYAVDYWDRYVDTSLAVIDIVVDFTALGGTTLATGGTDYYYDYSANGLDFWAPATQIELTTGSDFNGANADIYLTVDLDSLQSNDFYFFSDEHGTNGVSLGANGKIDLWTVFVHEIGHGLGLLSFLDEGGIDRTSFDAFVQSTPFGYQFVGPTAGSVELDASYAHFASNLGSVFGPYIGYGEANYLTPLELSVMGDTGVPLVTATAGGDVLYAWGVGANFTLDGLAGNDTLYGLHLADVIAGGDGDDIVHAHWGDDKLYGGAGDDTLNADDGDDTIYGDDGADLIRGGYGDDLVDYTLSPAGIDVVIGVSASGGFAQGDTLNNVERIFGSGFDDHIVGGSRDESLLGQAGADYIDGGAGNDTIAGALDYMPANGDGFRDTLVGGAGGDMIYGDDFDLLSYFSSTQAVEIDLENGIATGGHATNDSIAGVGNVEGSAFDDTLSAGFGDNLLIGGDGDDSLFGNYGDDTLEGGAGADTLDGGYGIDEIAYSSAASGITVDLAAGVAGGGAGADILTSIERVTGSAFADSILGDLNRNLLVGGNDDDTLAGRNGDDTLIGGAGADVLQGGSGVDWADYSGAASSIVVSLISGGSLGDAAGDVVASVENLLGSAFNDTLSGNHLANWIDGGDGADSLFGHDGDDLLKGRSGDDTLTGGAGADTLQGGDGMDLIDGGAGADTLQGGDGMDLIDGGAGIDTVDYSYQSFVIVRLSDPTGGDDVVVNVENIIGSSGADLLVGDDGDNYIKGNGAYDTLIGGLGADTLEGSNAGGSAIGAADYSAGTAGIFVDLIGGATGGYADGDVLIRITEIIGTDFADQFVVSALGHQIHAGDGDDVINATTIGGVWSHDTYLSGGDGDDIFYLAGKNAYAVGGAGFDTVSYEFFDGFGSGVGVVSSLWPSMSFDTFFDIEGLAGSAFADELTGDTVANVLAGNVGDDTLYGAEGDDTLDGGAGDDFLYGGLDNDSVGGFAGRDAMYGEDGADTLHGYGSHDTLYGGNGDDDLRGGFGRDLLNGSGGDDVLRGFEGDDRIFGGGGADTLLGNEGDDSLTGGGGGDRLKGDAGDDTLNGRFGADTVSGGAGDDLFEFRQGHGNDVIDDFTAGAASEDVVRLIGFGAAFDSFAEVLAASSQIGANVVIDFGGGDSITLENATLASLHADDFTFN